MTVKFGWGWKVALLYSSFVGMMIMLVVASSRQKFDLVSKDYYKDEITFQKVIDAGRNQANLSGALTIRADSDSIRITFPGEFTGTSIEGNVTFYSVLHKEWDMTFPIQLQNNTMTISRHLLKNTNYTLKIAYSSNGKEYYKENDINLSL